MQKCVAGGEGGVMLAAGVAARVSFSPSRSRVPVKISHLGGNFIHFLYTLFVGSLYFISAGHYPPYSM